MSAKRGSRSTWYRGPKGVVAAPSRTWIRYSVQLACGPWDAGATTRIRIAIRNSQQDRYLTVTPEMFEKSLSSFLVCLPTTKIFAALRYRRVHSNHICVGPSLAVASVREGMTSYGMVLARACSICTSRGLDLCGWNLGQRGPNAAEPHYFSQQKEAQTHWTRSEGASTRRVSWMVALGA